MSLSGIIHRLRSALARSVEHRGLGGTLAHILRFPFRKLRQRLIKLTPGFKRWKQARLQEEIDFDQTFHTDTGGIVHPELSETLGENRFHGNFYLGVLPSEFEQVMALLPIDTKAYVFIDYGSGKGRALLLASNRAFKAIYGIEYAPELHAIAEQNIRTYRNSAQQCHDITSLCMDAAAFDLPPAPTVVFLHNPFGRKVIDALLVKIQASLQATPRDLWVVYQYPVIAEPFDQAAFLTLAAHGEGYRIYHHAA